MHYDWSKGKHKWQIWAKKKETSKAMKHPKATSTRSTVFSTQSGMSFTAFFPSWPSIVWSLTRNPVGVCLFPININVSIHFFNIPEPHILMNCCTDSMQKLLFTSPPRQSRNTLLSLTKLKQKQQNQTKPFQHALSPILFSWPKEHGFCFGKP